MYTATIHEAKTQLSHLIEMAERGEEIGIARGKKPIVRLVPMVEPPKKRHLGILKGTIKLRPEFFDPLPEEELELWSL